MAEHPRRRGRATARVTGTAVAGLAAGALTLTGLAPAALAAESKVATSFEDGAAVTRVVDADGVTQPGSDAPGLTASVDDGPDSGYTAKADVGFTGTHALRYAGTHDADGAASATLEILDVDVTVEEVTRLSYVLFPQFDEQEIDYASGYVALDLAFTDGTRLSELGAVDDHGIALEARPQGESATIFPRQWNHKSADVGAVAAGKTVDAVLLTYDGPAGPVDLEGWVDDVEIGPAPDRSGDTRPSDRVVTTRGTNSNADYSRGNNFPATAVPNGFNFWTPLTDAGSLSTLYHYQEHNNGQNLPEIQAFSSSHQPSIWMGDRQTFQFMPSAADGVPDASRSARALAFSHDDEKAAPHHYAVTFQNGLKAEMAPTDHAAALRFTFPESGGRHIILDNVNDDADYTVDAEAGTFTGWSDVKGAAWSSVGMQRMYVYGEFSEDVSDAADLPGLRQSTGYVSFDAGTVEMRVATSLIGVEQARRNLRLEIAAQDTFDDVVAGAQQTWDDRLGVVEVEGASEDQLTTLYSNLYRINLYPNSAYENTGTAAEPVYRHADQSSADWDIAPGTTATETGAEIIDGKVFVNTGFWDTFRAAWPAYSLLWPDVGGELVDGFVQQYRDGGWVSPWSSPGYARVMTGTSSDSAFADAYVKGVPGVDARDTYDAALKNATVRPPSGAIGRLGLDRSNFLGFVPNDVDGPAFAWSKDGAMNDFAIAQMAGAMADDPATPGAERQQLAEESEYLTSRAQEYVNLWDADAGFFQGRSADGEWTTPSDSYDPELWGNDHDYAESNGWNEVFPAPYDGEGLATLLGGRDALADKLDEYFSTPETGLKRGSYGSVIHEMRETRDLRLGQWSIPNQVSHHIPWMYAYTQEPWKAHEQVRAALQRGWVGSEIGQGYPGDEDNGATSAWAVLSAVGLYPLQMATGRYAIGSPLFERATLHLPGGDVVINAPGTDEDTYVRSLRVDGKKHKGTTVSHDVLADGATLDFTMGDSPSRWGTGARDVPDSLTDVGDAPDPLRDATGPHRGVASTSGGEAGPLFDDTSATEATVSGAEPWVGYQVNAGRELPVRFYTLTSGGDAALDPTSWRVEGSDDGKTWRVLDERSGEDFPWRNQTRPFKLAKDAKAVEYRVVFTGGDDVRLAEVELLTPADMPDSQVRVSVGDASLRAGDTATVPVTVRNAGDKALGVDVAAALGDGWTVDPVATRLDVPAEGEVSVDLTVTPTAGAAPGDHTLEVTATWGPWAAAGKGTVTLVGDVTEVRPGTPAEEVWLVADDGSALAEADGGHVRYADNESTFTYRVPLADARAGTLTLDIANQFLVEASSDQKSWTTVLEETGSPIFESNRAERTLDVAALLAGTGSTDGSLYLRVGDSSPGDGWGGKLFRTRLEISSVPEEAAAPGS